MAIEKYMACLDGPEPIRGLDLMEPDIEFSLSLPSGEVTGSGRDDLAAYIRGRPNVGRRHHILRQSFDDDLDMVYGQVTEGNGVSVGSFVAVARVSANRRISRYQAFFHSTFGIYAPIG